MISVEDFYNDFKLIKENKNSLIYSILKFFYVCLHFGYMFNIFLSVYFVILFTDYSKVLAAVIFILSMVVLNFILSKIISSLLYLMNENKYNLYKISSIKNELKYLDKNDIKLLYKDIILHLLNSENVLKDFNNLDNMDKVNLLCLIRNENIKFKSNLNLISNIKNKIECCRTNIIFKFVLKDNYNKDDLYELLKDEIDYIYKEDKNDLYVILEDLLSGYKKYEKHKNDYISRENLSLFKRIFYKNIFS